MMNFSTWTDIYEMDDEEFSEYSKNHNHPLPMPIVDCYDGLDYDSPLYTWIREFILSHSFQEGYFLKQL